MGKSDSWGEKYTGPRDGLFMASNLCPVVGNVVAIWVLLSKQSAEFESALIHLSKQTYSGL